MRNFWRFIVHKLSDGIEKSTTGMLIMLVCMGLILYLTLKEGGSGTVSDLISMAMIVAAALMGVNSITDIFKRDPYGPSRRDPDDYPSQSPRPEDEDDLDP